MPALWPAGLSPAWRRSLRIVVAATLNPSVRSSPGDPLVVPAAVLARESEDQLADLTADRRSPRARRWVGPAPRHELALPAHERVGRDEERTPALAREQPAGGGQERAVDGPKRGPRNLAPQDGELMTKNDDLELLELLGAAAKRDKLQQSLQSDVEQ